MESETLPSTRPLSSALPRQGWPRLSPSHAPRVVSAAGPSHSQNANPRYEPATDDAAAAHRNTASCHLNSDPRPLSRPARADIPSDRRPATTIPTRPVLVRAYSGDANDKPRRPSTMSARRFFPFSSLRNLTPSRPPQPEIILPSDKDFSIESILQAIEPDIRGTLESIAEICGRSKLSLANEYGSHIAPLGEICAPPSALGPVEEASPSEERRADDITAVIVDEEANPIDLARDMYPFSFHRYLENLRHTESMMEQNDAPGQQIQRQSNPPRSPGMDSEAETVLAIGSENVSSTPFTRDFVSRPKHSGCDLLAKNAASNSGQQKSSQMATPAVVSEVHLAARADDGSAAEHSLLPNPALARDGSVAGSTGPEIIQSLLGWLKWTANVTGPDSRPALQSAEDRLRAMLDRPGSGPGTTGP
ncbi:hypothetical protein N7475_007622 [Penicillium sp. IBT 31633x]|nr:hypothetical protein N7475_007622 [Penicillium sp. IBT 31633x]